MNLQHSLDNSPYLSDGEHVVTVRRVKLVTANSGSDGYEVTMTDRHGRECKRTFWVTEKSVVFLARFAVACGLSEAERKACDTDRPDSMQALIGRQVRILWGLGQPNREGKAYREVLDFKPVADDTVTPATKPVPKPPPPPQNETTTRGYPPPPSEDDISPTGIPF